MTQWFIAIPILWQVTMIILAMIFITIIAVYGHIWVGWGKKKIGIGRETTAKERMCMDCSMHHRSTAAKVNFKITRIESSIMKNKMNNAEQELLDLKRNLYTNFSKILKTRKVDNIESELKEFNTRIRLVLNDVVKDEVRRSIKENGFHQKTGDTFVRYVDGQVKVINDLIEDTLLLYYTNDVILEISGATKDKLVKVVKSIYHEAKEIELKATTAIKKCEKEYDDTLNKYISTFNKSR